MNTTSLRVRVYECDALQHVNNAVYIQYLQQAAFEALGAPATARKLAIEYHAPAKAGDELCIESWNASVEGSRVHSGYVITRQVDRAAIVRGQVEWQMAEQNEQKYVPDNRPMPLKIIIPSSDNSARTFHWRHTVRRYELDSSNRASLAAYFNWLEQATYGYCEEVGWGMERLREEDFIVLQRRHDAEFFAPAHYGDELEMKSRLVEVRPVRGTWIHELYNAEKGILLMRDYSMGAFVDWSGHIKPALAPMMAALMGRDSNAAR